ncbi:hypothetical protein Vspart_02178 [Vibrio spartinae]|uniref:Transposase n=1 Tax=Vibrio spartinae TaxID=1918945 RepID=A0ABX6R0L5_9VIBR|nr:hypothetical protein Vspart_02178 [Vibrio spartinae]
MIEHSIVFIGLDTHKEFIEIAYNNSQKRFIPQSIPSLLLS